MLVAFCAGTPKLVEADPPAPTLRTFGFYATGQQQGPDFTSDDSRLVTVMPDALGGAGYVIEFSSVDENPTWLRGTRWETHPAHHASQGGETISGVYFWMLDPDTAATPPVGAHTFTGPDGLILEQFSFRIALHNGDGDYGDGNKWHVVTGNGQGTPFVVVMAVFSR
jgi:hypothetical protein